MLFNSLEFLLFFPVVVALYFATPARYRWILLLAASYYFYAAWKAEYLVLIIGSTVVDYWAGLRMGRHETRTGRRPFLIASVVTNLGVLFTFKYFNFFNDSVRAVLDRANIFYDVPAFELLLPVGISFYTFQSLSYSIDVYRGQKTPERHLGIFALYVAFFPQLVAGPIERSTHLLPQFFEQHRFEYDRAVDGLRLILWGFFKKLVIADRLAIYVNEVYGNPGAHSGGAIALATYFFAFQIYCDFSGYSDIAIGSARVMGYDLMDNFRRPYFAKSIREFWSRWHISLSTWFRDYVYVPLGGSRVATWVWYSNLMIVFLVSGLWHGANWTFVVWGGLHGTYMVVGLATQRLRSGAWDSLSRGFRWFRALPYRAAVAVHDAGKRVLRAAPESPAPVRQNAYSLAAALPSFRPLDQANPASDGPPTATGGESRGTRRLARTVRRLTAMVATFHLVLFAWIFFRANSVSDAVLMIRRMFSWETAGPAVADVALGRAGIMVALAAILFMEIVHVAERREGLRSLVARQPTWVRWTAYYAVVVAILVFGTFTNREFIYFQF